MSVRLSYSSARLVAASLVALLTLCEVSAKEIPALDSASQALVAAIEHRAEKGTSLRSQLAVIAPAIDAYADSNTFSIASALLGSAHDLAVKQPVRETAMDTLFMLFASIDRSRLTAKQSTHIDLGQARMKVLYNLINEGEAELLELLNRPIEDVFGVTRAQAHYMAAYSAYFTKQLDRAAYHSAQAAADYLRVGNTRGAMEAYDGASTTFFALQMVDSAIHYARRGLAVSEGLEPALVSNLWLNYAEALGAIGKTDSAFYYAELAHTVNLEQGLSTGIGRSEQSLGNLNARFGRYGVAVGHYENSIAHFTISQELYYMVDPLDSLTKTYAHLGNYKKAYEVGKRVFALRDSMRADRMKRDADKLVAEYQRDALAAELHASKGERELANSIVQARTSERRSVFAIGLTLLSILCFAVYQVRLRSRHSKLLQLKVDMRTAELRERQVKLERQSRRLAASNAELERFAYIASHDLKTPLRNVTSFLGLINRRMSSEARADIGEYVDIAIANARQMHDLVTDVLEFSRLNADKLAKLDTVTVAAVINSIRLQMQGQLAESNASIELVGNAKLQLPKGALEQIVGNLISNGLKYNRTPRPLVKVVLTELPGRKLRIAVSDNGIGIDPAYHERIFEVFRRLHTSDEFSGTGVGLAASKKMAERLGGSITVDSTFGSGSTFIVDLPLDVTAHLKQRADDASVQALS